MPVKKVLLGSLFTGFCPVLATLLITSWRAGRNQVHFLSVADDGQFLVTVSPAGIPWTQHGVLLTPLLTARGCFGAWYAIGTWLADSESSFEAEVLLVVAAFAFLIAITVAAILRLHGYRLGRHSPLDAD